MISNPALSLEEKKKLHDRAEQILLEIANMFKEATGGNNSSDIEDILSQSSNLDEQIGVDEFMRKFGEELGNSDPDEDINDDDILSM
jgi:hypothetical protein